MTTIANEDSQVSWGDSPIREPSPKKQPPLEEGEYEPGEMENTLEELSKALEPKERRRSRSRSPRASRRRSRSRSRDRYFVHDQLVLAREELQRTLETLKQSANFVQNRLAEVDEQLENAMRGKRVQLPQRRANRRGSGRR